LRRPPLEDRLAIDQCITESVLALPLMLDGAMDRALTKIHAKPPRPKPPPRLDTETPSGLQE
jgi:PTH1 family peptidyl-tRNA hydrolase